MQVKIQSIHFDADKKLIEFVNERVSRLSQYQENITKSEVFLKIDKSNTNENKIAEIRLALPGKELFASRQCKTFEEAIDLSVEAIRAQIKKYKGKTLVK
jgi:putative sigma-54 modulation protein